MTEYQQKITTVLGVSNKQAKLIYKTVKMTEYIFFFRIVSNLNTLKTRTLLAHAGYFGVSLIHQILMWTTGSLTHICDLFVCV